MRRRANGRGERLTLITGGAGFIGTNLAHRLASAGERVLIYDNLSRPGVARNLDWLRQRHGERIGVAAADIRDAEAVEAAVARATQVFHLAAQVAVTTSLVDPAADFAVNAVGTLNLLEAIRRSPHRPPLVFTSTNKVYGAIDDLSLDCRSDRYLPSRGSPRAIDERRPLDFHSPYGCSKGAADQYVLDYARSFGLAALVFRMSCIYGPHQCGTEDQGWVAHFLLRTLAGDAITLYGDGKQVRDILYVDDLVDAFLLAQRHMAAIGGRAYNIGGGIGNALSLVELLARIEQLHGTLPRIRYGAWRTGDQLYYVSDCTRFAEKTGWRPRVAAEEGVALLYRWLRERHGVAALDARLAPRYRGRPAAARSRTARMRVALVNPPWDFAGSIYFGCREPHLPLEYGYARQMLEAQGHTAEIIDGQLEALSAGEIKARVEAFAPDMTVVTSAPSYLFWRCAPPELRVPRHIAAELRRPDRLMVAIGPHASTTPGTALAKLDVDVVVMGEAEEVLCALAGARRADWPKIAAIAYRDGSKTIVQGGPHASDMAALPALEWPDAVVGRHHHHHHRFDQEIEGSGAEMETSRGCPYHCTFCAKENFRDAYRRRPLPTILRELDRLIAQGVRYVYFIDEIFLPNRPLLQALVERRIKFGMQTRIDLWTHEMVELLGRAGCVSIEAGVESLSPEGRERLDKRCRMSTADLTERLIFAKRHVAFVQANLIAAELDDADEIARWRETLQAEGVWANEPVPLFPYPGTPDYRRLWGLPDDRAWERAHAHYLRQFDAFSDIQEQRPKPLHELESLSAS